MWWSWFAETNKQTNKPTGRLAKLGSMTSEMRYLNPDCLVSVFWYFPAYEVTALREVSKAWNLAASSNPLWMRLCRSDICDDLLYLVCVGFFFCKQHKAQFAFFGFFLLVPISFLERHGLRQPYILFLR
jgi:hypothetical protein